VIGAAAKICIDFKKFTVTAWVNEHLVSTTLSGGRATARTCTTTYHVGSHAQFFKGLYAYIDVRNNEPRDVNSEPVHLMQDLSSRPWTPGSLFLFAIVSIETDGSESCRLGRPSVPIVETLPMQRAAEMFTPALSLGCTPRSH